MCFSLNHVAESEFFFREKVLGGGAAFWEGYVEWRADRNIRPARERVVLFFPGWMRSCDRQYAGDKVAGQMERNAPRRSPPVPGKNNTKVVCSCVLALWERMAPKAGEKKRGKKNMFSISV